MLMSTSAMRMNICGLCNTSNNRILAGGGVTERPFMSAGGKWRRFRSKGRKYPIVRGVAQAAYVHPHGGGRHQHVGQSSTVSRNAPPGAKVGSIAARKTGRARIKERK